MSVGLVGGPAGAALHGMLLAAGPLGLTACSVVVRPALHVSTKFLICRKRFRPDGSESISIRYSAVSVRVVASASGVQAYGSVVGTVAYTKSQIGKK